MGDLLDTMGPSIAWREAGKRAAPPIVLLHGLGGSRTAWDAVIVELAKRGFRPAAWDMPGYGASPPLPGAPTFAALALAVGRFADELGVERFHLVGMSFGGMIAVHAAAAMPHRVDSLTLMATSPAFGLDGTDPVEWRSARLAPLDAGRSPAEIAPRVLAALAGPSITDDALASQCAAMGRITADALRRSVDLLVSHDVRDLLPTISAPTLCLAGGVDDETPVAYAEALAGSLPDGTVRVIPGVGHLLNAEAPVAVAEAIVAHVRGEAPA